MRAVVDTNAALEARAAFVVSGDRDLLAMRRFRSVRIVGPATFLRILRDTEAQSSSWPPSVTRSVGDINGLTG
jgi:hypothetical protein